MDARKVRPTEAPGSPLGPSAVRLPGRIGRAATAANRLASSRLARTIVALAVLALAALLIHGELKSSRLNDVAHAIAATPPWAIGASAAFTVLTYLSEGVLEWRVLRYIGRPLKLWRTLLAASASSALSIALGFGIASGTAVRLRFYAFAHLSAGDVAKVTALVSGAIFLVGLAALGLSGLGGLSTVTGLLHWPPWSVAILAAALLAIVPGWFWALRRWRGHDPMDLKARALTLGAALGNWLFQGAALFVLASPNLSDFPAFFAAFALAALFGSALGVPADLGVLDATVLASHTLGPVHQAAAALVLYRVIFHLIPMILATAAMMARPAVRAARRIGG